LFISAASESVSPDKESPIHSSNSNTERRRKRQLPPRKAAAFYRAPQSGAGGNNESESDEDESPKVKKSRRSGGKKKSGRSKGMSSRPVTRSRRNKKNTSDEDYEDDKGFGTETETSSLDGFLVDSYDSSEDESSDEDEEVSESEEVEVPKKRGGRVSTRNSQAGKKSSDEESSDEESPKRRKTRSSVKNGKLRKRRSSEESEDEETPAAAHKIRNLRRTKKQNAGSGDEESDEGTTSPRKTRSSNKTTNSRKKPIRNIHSAKNSITLNSSSEESEEENSSKSKTIRHTVTNEQPTLVDDNSEKESPERPSQNSTQREGSPLKSAIKTAVPESSRTRSGTNNRSESINGSSQKRHVTFDSSAPKVKRLSLDSAGSEESLFEKVVVASKKTNRLGENSNSNGSSVSKSLSVKQPPSKLSADLQKKGSNKNHQKRSAPRRKTTSTRGSPSPEEQSSNSSSSSISSDDDDEERSMNPPKKAPVMDMDEAVERHLHSFVDTTGLGVRNRRRNYSGGNRHTHAPNLPDAVGGEESDDSFVDNEMGNQGILESSASSDESVVSEAADILDLDSTHFEALPESDKDDDDDDGTDKSQSDTDDESEEAQRTDMGPSIAQKCALCENLEKKLDLRGRDDFPTVNRW
jgi:hypothetical protein